MLNVNNMMLLASCFCKKILNLFAYLTVFFIS